MRLPVSLRRLVVATALTAAAAAPIAATAGLPAATAATPRYVNPVAGIPWGRYTGGSDGLYPAYEAATGATKKALGYEALHPHVRWYTGYIPPSEIKAKVAADIAAEQAGNPNTLMWMATFDLWPHQESAAYQPLTTAERDAFTRWVDGVAAGIGSAHAAVIVEPDLPVIQKSWHPWVREAMVNYEVRRYAALPNTVVYLDAGSGDWRPMSQEIPLLRASGIAYAHGFSLGDTHHTRLGGELRYGRAVAMNLQADGLGNKHFIVDTADNGAGYSWAQFYSRYPSGTYNNPPACTSRSQRVCVSLGVPPTTAVADPRWGLSPTLEKIARNRVDAYMWVARPWMANNDETFDVSKAVDIVRSSPFA